MRWIGLALAIVAIAFLAWEVFALPPGGPQPAFEQLDRKSIRIVSAVGITGGLLLIVMSPRKFIPRHSRTSMM